MKVSQWYSNVAAVTIALAVFCLGCGMAEMDSRWRDRDIDIDGLDAGPEWEYARYFLDKQQVTMGIMNDDEALYLRLSSRDTAIQRQVLLAGLTIWFDTDGEQNKTFGLHFPVGVGEDGIRDVPAMPQLPPSTPMGRGGFRQNAIPTEAIEDAVNGMLAAAGDRIEVLGPDAGASSRMDREEALGYGIEYAIAYAAGNMVYELRIPLHRTGINRYGISTSGNHGAVTIGFETGEMPEFSESHAAPPRDSGSDDDNESDDGLVGNTGGEMAGTFRPGMRNIPFTPPPTRPLDLWLTAHLADGE